MLKSLKFVSYIIFLCSIYSISYSQTLGLGRAATNNELSAWDIDIRPDGKGLPVGSGSVIIGEELYTENCSSCHGDFGEGIDRWPELAGGFDTLDSEDPVKTVGSYWPYLSTVWDYVHRAMPFGNAQSLNNDEVYAITAYILYLNDLVDEDFELSHVNFEEINLPNEENFYLDNRENLENTTYNNRCMQNCKKVAMITKRAVVLDVTPEEDMTENNNLDKNDNIQIASFDPNLVKEGEKVFKKCKACHRIGLDAKNGTGPHLNNIFGRVAGELRDYKKYSKNIKKLGQEGLIWNNETLISFLENPKKYIKGTKMNFKGIKKSDELDALVEYLAASTKIN
jgi:cytochrome c